MIRLNWLVDRLSWEAKKLLSSKRADRKYMIKIISADRM